MKLDASLKSHKAFKAFENFKIKSKEKYGELYDYSKVIYKGNKKTITIICSIHGEFEQFPGNHLLGGCKKCGQEPRRKTQIDFLKEASAVHSNKYTYPNLVYINAKTDVAIVCPKHSVFMQTPDTHLKGSGCPECAKIHQRQKFFNEPTILYCLHFYERNIYKIGITMQRIGIKKRYECEKEPFNIIQEILYIRGEDAYYKEQSMLKKYSDYKYTGPPILIKRRKL